MKKLTIVLGLLLGLSGYEVMAQCGALRQQRNITFNTDKDCAPVSVTDFTITYFFNVPQNPGEIEIRFEWNNPAGSINQYGLGDPEFLIDGTNTEFTATGTFTYPEDENCVFEPASFIIVNGDICETSEQLQLVTSWSDDNNFGGVMDIQPGNFDVCFDNAIIDAVFTDNSTFNCNINQNPDTPNRQERFTQFVYGTNHNPANSIRNLTLVDGGGSPVNLTDGTASLSTTSTINGVTGAYFGPIENIPFPADGPVSVSLPLSAPADVNNLVGSVFEVTLFNWNICNPYNGNPASPNYIDAVQTQAFVRIVNPPVPDFQTRVGNAAGAVETVFCLGDNVYFENLSTVATDYVWGFYDDPTGSSLIASSNSVNPTFVFTNPGDKLIRLTARNGDANGTCEDFVVRTITLSPSAVAGIGFFDPSLTTPITPAFCSQDGTVPITVGFKDQTISPEPQTEWRWEFYDENGLLAESIPGGPGSYGPSVTDFTRDYVSQGAYLVRLIARNNASGCESIDEGTIYVYDTPESYFENDTVCVGDRTTFFTIPDSVLSLSPRVNNDVVEAYEWDFSYNGVTFNVERSTDSDDSFSQFLSGTGIALNTEPVNSVAGTFTVALRMRTALGNCSNLFTRQVTVSTLPVASLSSNYSQPLCPGGAVSFTNTSDLVQASYRLILSDSVGFSDTLDFNQATLDYTFDNDTDSIKTYYAFLIGTNPAGCTDTNGPIHIEILPSAPSGFFDPNYSAISANCSDWESTLMIDAATQALNADEYTWTISDASGILPGYPLSKTAGDPDFHQLDYTLINNTTTNQVFIVTLDVSKGTICIDGSQQEFLISPSPEAAFSVVEADSCTYKTIVLEADQSGLASYNWNFVPPPDQVFNENNKQSLTYLRPATGNPGLSLDLSLATENVVGCRSDTLTSTVMVAANELPITAEFQVAEDTIMQPDSIIQFTNLSSNYSGLVHAWDFGDGNVDTLYGPLSHSYTTPGIYEVTLTVSNDYCSSNYSGSVIIQPAAPLIDFSADTLEGCAPFTVQFMSLSSFADQSTFVWDFGDGNTSLVTNPVHTFGRGGTYTVSLYGENTAGTAGQEIKQNYITVYTRPAAIFEANPTTVRIPDKEVYFRNSSQNATSFMWDFGDGNTSTEEAPIHFYDTIGSYDIQLIAFNDFGCADTLLVPAVVQAIAGGDTQVPNAFSPSLSGPGAAPGGSGETINDVFIPQVEGVTKFRMLIYNKWGELLFESTSQRTGWDGYYKGILQPSDVYVYKLELTYSDGREGIKVGDVTLIR